MTKLNTNSKKGFTIIEVVLVLAIAGLIFLMVFIALPNLQRTQRDTQRRNDVDRLSSSLVQYVTNNNKLPEGTSQTVAGATVDATSTGWGKFYYNYLLAGNDDTFEDPDGGRYNLYIAECAATGCPTDLATTTNNGNTSTSGPLTAGYQMADSDSKYTAVIVKAARCGEDGSFNYVQGTRRFAVAMRLEGNGIYCVDN